MKRFLIKTAFVLCSVLAPTSVMALDIIYPQTASHSTWQTETYVQGNVRNNSTLTINGEPVKIWKKNIFCHVIPLEYGINKIVAEEKSDRGITQKIFTVNRPKPNTNKTVTAPSSPEIQKYKNLKLGNIITDGAPVRKSPTVNSDRITHLPENTNVLIYREIKDWYGIYVDDTNETLWINKKNVKVLYETNNRYLANVMSAKVSANRLFDIMQIQFDFPVPYKIVENGNSLDITFWGIKNISDIEKMIKKQNEFSEVKIKSCENNNLTLTVIPKWKLWGYDGTYDENNFVFKVRKAPKINDKKPLNNIIITIDAGHGGKEKGTIGPGRVCEKDVNLAISLKLKDELEKNGAKVIMTRDTDTDVALYQRPEIAKETNSLFSISIHSNSMVDGNPYKNHGIETYYYNLSAKSLADTIKNQMIQELNLKDNGTNRASFVLTRPTMPLSILVEVAYMPNPEEYLKLIDDNFQQRTAKAICNGIKKYLTNK